MKFLIRLKILTGHRSFSLLCKLLRMITGMVVVKGMAWKSEVIIDFIIWTVISEVPSGCWRIFRRLKLGS